MAGPIVTNDGMTPDDVEAYARQVEAQHGYKAGSLVAMLRQESRLGLNQKAHAASENSHATGIAQIQPGTAATLARQGFPVDVHNGKQSIDGMAHLMDTALARNGGNWDNAVQQYTAGSQTGINDNPTGSANYATAVASQLSLADAASQATYGAHDSAPPQASPPTATPSPTDSTPEKTVEQAASEATYGAHDSAGQAGTAPPLPSASTDPYIELKAGMQKIVNDHLAMGDKNVSAAVSDVQNYVGAMGYDPKQFTNLPVNVQTGKLTFGDHFSPQKMDQNALASFGERWKGAMQAIPATLNKLGAYADENSPFLRGVDNLAGMDPSKFRAQSDAQSRISQAASNNGQFGGVAGSIGEMGGTAMAAAPFVLPAMAALPETLGTGVGGFLAGQGGKNLLTKGLSLAAGGGIGGGVGGAVSGQNILSSMAGGALLGPAFGVAGNVIGRLGNGAIDAVGDAVGPTVARGVNAAGNAIESLTGRAVPTYNYTSSVDRNASSLISQRIAQDTAGGGQAPADIQAHAASLPDKPLTPMDYGANTQALGGRVYRNGGTGKQIIANTLDTRGKGASDRVEADVKNAISDKGSAYDTAEALTEQRAADAAPLYKQAFQGGSTAPLETQFEGALQASGAKVAQAQQAANAAQNESTQAAAQVSQSGDNVYAANSALARQKSAAQGLSQAQQDVVTAQAQHASNLDRLQQAQADGSANAPGAVWSPRIQQFVDDPIMKGGLARGLEIQRLESLAKGEPFNPSEYGVKGTDEQGNPIVGAVPNMRLLDAGKRGMDAIISDNTDPVTGRVNDKGRAVTLVKDAYLKELDTANPDYAAARQAYSGPSASMDALSLGKRILTMDPDEFKAGFNKLGDGDKEFARQGAVGPILKSVMKMGDAGTPPAALRNNAWVQKQMSPLFDSPTDYNTFINRVDAERTMAATRANVTKGSQTQDRNAQDNSPLDQAGHVIDAVQSGAHAATGSPVGILNFANALRRLSSPSSDMSPQLGNALAQKLTAPVGNDFNSLYGNAANARRFALPPVLVSGPNKLRDATAR